MGTSGDKIVLLDGMGSGSGSATNGLLSMIPGMFANLIGGNKMDPNLVAALMNGRNNQDGFGGANGWWLWIIVLFWLWGGRGFGNGFGNGGENCANGLPAQLNNDYGRELLMQAIQGNRSAIEQIANALNCTTTQLQSAICNVQGAIDKVAGQVGMTSQAVINAVSVILKDARDSMNVRTRCIAGDGSVSVASVTSSMVPSRICAGDAGVVTTEEQTPMTRIISGI